jgi:hypothetical protein
MACTPFIPNTLSAYSIAVITGYDSIVPDGMVIPNETPGEADKLGRIGVSHLITWPGNKEVPPEWKPVWNSPSMDLYENTLKLPRYHGFLTSDDKDRFFAGERPEVAPLPETGGRFNNRSLTVPAGVRWIRVTENEDDGWEYRATPSEDWKSVSRAPDASMLFENPEPERAATIEMRYNPPMRRIGFLSSGTALALILLEGVFSRRKRPGDQPATA